MLTHQFPIPFHHPRIAASFRTSSRFSGCCQYPLKSSDLRGPFSPTHSVGIVRRHVHSPMAHDRLNHCRILLLVHQERCNRMAAQNVGRAGRIIPSKRAKNLSAMLRIRKTVPRRSPWRPPLSLTVQRTTYAAASRQRLQSARLCFVSIRNVDLLRPEDESPQHSFAIPPHNGPVLESHGEPRPRPAARNAREQR